MILDEYLRLSEHLASESEKCAKFWDSAKPSYFGDERSCEATKESYLKTAQKYREIAGLLQELKVWRELFCFSIGCSNGDEILIPLEEAKKAACRALCHPGVFCPDCYCAEIRREFDKIRGVKIADYVKYKSSTADIQKKKCMFEPIVGRYPECDGNCESCSYFM